jgi:hypothetical protein
MNEAEKNYWDAEITDEFLNAQADEGALSLDGTKRVAINPVRGPMDYIAPHGNAGVYLALVLPCKCGMVKARVISTWN